MDNPDTSPSVVQPPDFPRFGIRHMLLWAVCLAAAAPVVKDGLTLFHGATTALVAALLMIRAIRQSAAVMALPLLVARWWRGARFPDCPGERYWLIAGVEAALWLIQWGAGLWSDTFLVARQSLLVVALDIHAAWRVGRGPWRWFFGIEAARVLFFRLERLKMLFLVFSDPVHAFYAVKMLGLLSIAVGVLCVVLDHRRGRRYPWTHWWGVGVLLASAEQVLWLFVK